MLIEKNKLASEEAPVSLMSPTAATTNATDDAITKWLSTTCAMLEELNAEHSRILSEYKNLVQFPDLYAELYSL